MIPAATAAIVALTALAVALGHIIVHFTSHYKIGLSKTVTLSTVTPVTDLQASQAAVTMAGKALVIAQDKLAAATLAAASTKVL